MTCSLPPQLAAYTAPHYATVINSASGCKSQTGVFDPRSRSIPITNNLLLLTRSKDTVVIRYINRHFEHFSGFVHVLHAIWMIADKERCGSDGTLTQ